MPLSVRCANVALAFSGSPEGADVAATAAAAAAAVGVGGPGFGGRSGRCSSSVVMFAVRLFWKATVTATRITCRITGPICFLSAKRPTRQPVTTHTISTQRGKLGVRGKETLGKVDSSECLFPCSRICKPLRVHLGAVDKKEVVAVCKVYQAETCSLHRQHNRVKEGIVEDYPGVAKNRTSGAVMEYARPMTQKLV